MTLKPSRLFATPYLIFGLACNQGADVANGSLLCFLNVDTEVQPGWSPPTITASTIWRLPWRYRIVHPDGSLQTAGGIRTWHGGGTAGGEELKERRTEP